MKYRVVIDPLFFKKLQKIFKKDKKLYEKVKKKIADLEQNPDMGKPLRNILKNKRRIHIGHHVLIYSINDEERVIELIEFEHHDKAYK